MIIAQTYFFCNLAFDLEIKIEVLKLLNFRLLPGILFCDQHLDFYFSFRFLPGI
jgi:hypothetical protein